MKYSNTKNVRNLNGIEIQFQILESEKHLSMIEVHCKKN